MELRKDPITRSWVIVGDELESPARPARQCPYCAGSTEPLQVVSTMPSSDGGGWLARAVVHPAPLYRVEGDPQRRAVGLYDFMRTVGAHEVLVENPRHDRNLWQSSDAEIAQFLVLVAQRIQDLKRDLRFKYVTFFKNHGPLAGQEFDHPTSQITATTFVPRRVLYELRAAKEYYAAKERCVFCDVLAQELRQETRVVESLGECVATCPYAPRVPYETWVMPRGHEASFERSALGKSATLPDLAALLRRTLLRVVAVTDAFHLVLHTVPNTYQKSEILGYWKTIDDDYHWHIEILPVIGTKGKSYVLKEVYYTPLTSETAAARLRDVPVS